MGKKWQIAKLRKNIFKFLFIFFRIHWVKKNMFTFCSLSTHFAKRRNNLLTLHCRKRTSLLCTVKKPIYRKRASSLCTVKKPIYRKRTSSLCTVKKPIYRKRISSLSAVKKQSVKLSLQKKNVCTFCSKETISSLSAVKKQSLHFLQ